MEKIVKRRSALTLNDSMHSLIGQLAELQGKTMTTVIGETLEASRPALEMMRDALVKVKNGVPKDEILSAMVAQGLRGVADSLELDLEGKKAKSS